MVHFIRNKDNKTIIECETYKGDLKSGLDLSYLLQAFLETPDVEQFKEDFCMLNELQRIWWENDPDSENVDEFVREHYIKIAEKYNLSYITD